MFSDYSLIRTIQRMFSSPKGSAKMSNFGCTFPKNFLPMPLVGPTITSPQGLHNRKSGNGFDKEAVFDPYPDTLFYPRGDVSGQFFASLNLTDFSFTFLNIAYLRNSAGNVLSPLDPFRHYFRTLKIIPAFYRILPETF